MNTGSVVKWIAGWLVAAGTARGAEPAAFSYGKDPKQSLNVYVPALDKGAKPAPVVVWVHGGGWRNGDKDNRAGMGLCQKWTTAGCVVVGLDYRLSPDVVHPAHVEDVAAGVSWIHQNISKHGGDPKRVFLLGHSAGAHLVALVATAPIYLKKHELTPKSALAGVMAIDTASYDLTATRTLLVRKMIADAFGDDAETLKGASPLLQAKRNPDECPPFIVAAVKQRPEAVQESKALADVLPKCELVVCDYPGGGQLVAHGLIAKDLLDFDKDLTKKLLAFVKGEPTPAK